MKMVNGFVAHCQQTSAFKFDNYKIKYISMIHGKCFGFGMPPVSAHLEPLPGP